MSGPVDALAVRREVERVVVTERWARDTARWEVMAGQYHPDSVVDVSWIRASGPEFVALSRQSFEAGGRGSHVVGPVLVDVDGDRALADTGAVIAGTAHLGGVPVVLTAYGRIVERLERRAGVWRISELRCVYQFDHLTPVDPGRPPALDPARLAGYRQSYAALSYWVEETRGAPAVRHDLPGVDRPGTVDALYAANAAWLEQGAGRSAHEEGAPA
ncbi:nuclear transport factor 2 family protein [Streptomyces albidoflavus]|uniref:nuclear transport factor 2 family protein n=1 Tax=Streptomyces albidoflavus TaxID=1886 RepID=UPI0033B10BC4